MYRPAFILLAAAAATVLAFQAFSPSPIETAEPERAAVARALRLPIAFEENRGQAGEDVLFTSLFASGTAEFRASGVSFVLGGSSPARIAAAGSLPNPNVRGGKRLESRSNHYVGNDPEKWIEGNPHYAEVVYEEVYPGIDWVWYGNGGRFEYDFRVAPGADPDQAKVAFGDNDKLALESNGDLLVRAAGQETRYLRPVVYQTREGERESVEGEYVLLAENRVGFALGEYDSSRELVIDPSLGFSTYFGDTRDEEDTSVVVDDDGNTYVGFTAGDDVVILKMVSDGSALWYTTRVGGSSREQAG